MKKHLAVMCLAAMGVIGPWSTASGDRLFSVGASIGALPYHSDNGLPVTSSRNLRTTIGGAVFLDLFTFNDVNLRLQCGAFCARREHAAELPVNLTEKGLAPRPGSAAGNPQPPLSVDGLVGTPGCKGSLTQWAYPFDLLVVSRLGRGADWSFGPCLVGSNRDFVLKDPSGKREVGRDRSNSVGVGLVAAVNWKVPFSHEGNPVLYAGLGCRAVRNAVTLRGGDTTWNLPLNYVQATLTVGVGWESR